MIRLRQALPTIGRTGAIVTAVMLFLFLFSWLVGNEQIAAFWKTGIDAKHIFKDTNDVRVTLGRMLGGFALLAGLFLTWQNITTRFKALALANNAQKLAKKGPVAKRLTKAIEQLRATDDKRNPKLKQRSGEIYALERMAHDVEEDHWPIMQVLTAYVRKNAQLKMVGLPETNPITTDIKAILAVICRRQWHYEKNDQTLDLHGTDLHDANLEGAYLRGADLEAAYLRRANLRSAYLGDAYLKGADLRGADLEAAYLRRTNLEGAYLRGADLVNADLRGVDLWGADLTGAYLRGADLRGAVGVTQEQINSAAGDANTKLPAGLIVPESWKKV